jgi:hypothetical protein
MLFRYTRASFVLGILAFAAALPAGAQLNAGPAPSVEGSASPPPSPAVAATASPRPLGLRFATSLSTTLLDQSTAGEGQVGPEAPGFINGSPLSPDTPYDLFSSAPLTPGFAGIGQAVATGTFRTPTLDLGVTTALGYVRGSVTNASYWGESLIPSLNPHLGSQALPYAIAFPTHAGQDDGTALRLSILSGSVATADGNLALKAGWFDLTQSDRFVFIQPQLTSVNPAIAYAPAETLTNGLAGTDVWQPDASALPLRGLDVVAKRDVASFELSSAALPALPGTSARMTLGSLVLDHGEGTRYSGELLHVGTSGAPFTTTVPFGANPQYFSTPQGTLPTSTLSGQQETIAGLRAAFHVAPALGLDGVAEIGRSWYDAQNVAMPGTARPGGYYHLGFTKISGRATASLDLYRMEPRYATAILPYGVPENQWSAAFAWPGQWLKSNYQLIDNSVLGVNRQGFRLRYYLDKGPLELHLEYTDLRQIEPETTVTAEYTGFVDGYYLPQAPGEATLGTQKRYALWAAWHPSVGDFTLDIVDDQLYRPFAVLSDQVSYEVPQAVLTYSRHFSAAVVGAVGVGRYAIKGAFSEPIDIAQRLYFAGAEIKETPRSSALLSFRRSIVSGTTTFPNSPLSPNFTGSQFIFEQRVQL